MVAFIDIVLLVFLAVTAIAIIRMRNLYAAVMLAGIYSLLSAGLFVTLDAVDVAFTEAAVGAGMATVLLLATVSIVGSRSKRPTHRPLLPLLVVLVTGAILVYGTIDMPPFGGADNPIHHHIADHYLEESGHEIGIPNVVTSVLASYRGYDTLGETTVIFAAAVGVLLVLGAGRGQRAGGGRRVLDDDGGERDRPGMGDRGEGPGAARDGDEVPNTRGVINSRENSESSNAATADRATEGGTGGE